VNFGPWSPTIQGEERGKQLRSLASIAHVILGPRHPSSANCAALKPTPSRSSGHRNSSRRSRR
jgi:hypothetical protein